MNNETYLNANLNHEVVIELPSSPDDMGQNILILTVTNEGVEFNFYNDGEITSSMARTYEELNDEAESATKSRANHPTNWKKNKDNPL